VIACPRTSRSCFFTRQAEVLTEALSRPSPSTPSEGVIERLREAEAALRAISDESVFNQLRYAEEDDTDYFLRCFRAVKERARAALARLSPLPLVEDKS
jgi:hypothetical protein